MKQQKATITVFVNRGDLSVDILATEDPFLVEARTGINPMNDGGLCYWRGERGDVLGTCRRVIGGEFETMLDRKAEAQNVIDYLAATQ